MTKRTFSRAAILAALAAPQSFAGTAWAQGQAAGDGGHMAFAESVGEMTCTELMGFAPPDLERMVYYIAGFEAGRRGAGAGDRVSAAPDEEAPLDAEDGEDERATVAPDGTGDRPADPAADPRMRQVQPAERGSGLEIDLERVQAECQEDPARFAIDVVQEIRAAEGGAGVEVDG
jgi:hypothetical protein